jgi:hypothetical protein
MPFFLVKDDSIDATPPVSTYNKFAMGASDNFDVVFNLNSGPLKFDMYLTFGYGAAARGADKPSFLAPKYFNPEFNRKNAWKVAVTPPTETWKDNEPTVEKTVEVKVWDWQQGATVSTTVPYSTEVDKTKVFEASTVSRVEIELFGDYGEALTSASGLGTPGSPLVYNVSIANSLSRPAGNYIGLVKITDSRTPAAAFTEGQDFLIDTPDGFTLNNVLMSEFATYQTFEAEIIIGCGPIVLGTVTGCPVAPVVNNSNINFTIAATSFGATVLTFEMDSDYNGTTFVPDGPSNTTGIFNSVNFNSSPCVIGDTFDVAVRISDDCPIPNSTIFELCLVEIGQCCGPIELGTVTGCPVAPVANSSNINFTVTASSFASTQISYEMDSDYNGVTFVPDGPSNLTGIFNNVNFNSSPCVIGDTFDVAVRLTDNCPTPNVSVFEICTVEIGTCCGPIELGAVTGCPVAPIWNNTNVSFTVAASSFGATVFTFEMDSDYNGTTFVPDGAGNTTGIFNNVNFTSSPCSIGDTFDVAVRITDNCPTPNVSIFEICTVEIGVCCGPATDPTGTAVTDPSYTYLVYCSTNAGIAPSTNGRQRVWGLESSASGNGYIYTAFQDTNGHVYFTRSGDAGTSWLPITTLFTGAANSVQGTAIAAVGAEVFVIYSDLTTGDLILAKNTTSGTGAWSYYTIFDGLAGYYIYCNGIAVDPTNTTYAAVAFHYGTSALTTLPTTMYHAYSSTGGATWTNFTIAWGGAQPYCADIQAGPDGTFYVARQHNSYTYFKKSTDHGVTWSATYQLTNGAGWGQSCDLVVDPSNANTLYYVYSTHGTSGPVNSPHLQVAKSTDGGVTWPYLTTQLEINLQIADVGDMPMQPSISIDTAGNVYVAFTWCFSTAPADYEIYVAKSCDAGVSFSDADWYLISSASPGYDVCPALTPAPAADGGGLCLTWIEDGYSSNLGAINANGVIISRHIY